MSDASTKTFDCVQNMRQARDRISAEIGSLNYDEMVKWFGAQQYKDPLLRRLVEKSARLNKPGVCPES